MTKWQDGEIDKDMYTHMPYHYDIEGIEIHFLPHWNFYKIESINLSVPVNSEDIFKAVNSVKTLINLGLKKEKC